MKTENKPSDDLLRQLPFGVSPTASATTPSAPRAKKSAKSTAAVAVLETPLSPAGDDEILEVEILETVDVEVLDAAPFGLDSVSIDSVSIEATDTIDVESDELEFTEAESFVVADIALEAPAVNGFVSLNLPDALLQRVIDAGFTEPTPIQARAIPTLLSGADVIGQAQTGTGKTAAFALPLLASLDPTARGVQALVLVPTRELALQAAEQITRFAGTDRNSARVVAVYGGQPIDRQLRALYNPPAIVVGTPGRLIDHINRGSIDLSKVRFCALDEADEMLAIGFFDDIVTILATLPAERQTALFSATLPPRIESLAARFLREPVLVRIESARRAVETVKQSFYIVPPGRRQDSVARLLGLYDPEAAIVFCRTRAETQALAEMLAGRGFAAEPLHGEMAQPERDRVMRRLKEGRVRVLVATDVAARGLDIDTVTLVVNVDLPNDASQYVHRIGRTGRAGREGDSVTLLEPRERRAVPFLQRSLGIAVTLQTVPTIAEVTKKQRERLVQSVGKRIEAGGFEDLLELVTELAEDRDPLQIAAAALAALTEGKRRDSDNTDENAFDGAIAEMARRDAPRAPAARSAASQTRGIPVDAIRLWLGVGAADGLRPGDLVGAVTSETGLPNKVLGGIDIRSRSTLFDVPAEHSEKIIEALSNLRWRGRKIRVDHATE